MHAATPSASVAIITPQGNEDNDEIMQDSNSESSGESVGEQESSENDYDEDIEPSWVDSTQDAKRRKISN